MWFISWLGFGTTVYLHLLAFTALVMDDGLDIDTIDTTGRIGMHRSRFDFLEYEFSDERLYQRLVTLLQQSKTRSR